MSIINTHTFWNYILNESEIITNRCMNLLTRKYWNVEKEEYDLHTYYTIVSTFGWRKVLRFPAGLTAWLAKEADLEIEDKPLRDKTYTEEDVLTAAKQVQLINPKFEIRDYQLEAALTSLNQFSSLIHASIGSGKTSIMSLICKVFSEKRILILNDNNKILDQIYERICSFGMEDEVSWHPSEEPDYSARIVLINSSTSDSRLNSQNEDYINFLKEVNVWIVDECHKIQALTEFEPVFYMDQDKLQHIVGYSGSPFRNYKYPYKNEQDFRTIAILGEPAFTYEMKNAIQDGNIAQPYSYFINYKNKTPYLLPQFKNSYFMQYRMSITYNKNRNAAGLAMLKFLNKNGIKTLASYNTIKPGQNMMKSLAEEGIKTLFICGADTIHEWKPNKRGTLKLETRKGGVEDVKAALHGDYNIIFASQVMDEGVDIDIFQAAVLFSAGKTPIANIQRIGRSSRRRTGEPNVSFVVDFKDIDGLHIFRDHYEQRKQMMIDSGVKNIEKVKDFCDLIEKINNCRKNSLENL